MNLAIIWIAFRAHGPHEHLNKLASAFSKGSADILEHQHQMQLIGRADFKFGYEVAIELARRFGFGMHQQAATPDMLADGGDALVENARIVSTDTFEDPNMPGEMKLTITLDEVSCGTQVTITQEGLPDAVAPEHCYLGWQESLELMAKLVEPEIPDES